MESTRRVPDGPRATRTLRTLRAWARRPAGSVTLLLIGVILLFGAPLLAQHDEPAPTATSPVESPVHPVPGHGEEASHEEGTVHPPTLVSITATLIEGRSVHAPDDAHHPVARFLLQYTAPIFSFLVIAILSTLFFLGTRRMSLNPGRFQNVVEWAVEGLDRFICGVLGHEGRRFVPFLGTLFLYIYFQNVFGLIPLMFTPTSMVETTAAMAIMVFLYVQWTAVRSNGLLGYVRHLAGDPQDVIGWAMTPLMLPLHIVGELAKPLSLSLRLFGNMMGEETLIAVFIGLGIAVLGFLHLPLGLPLQVPFIFLALLTTLIQALVFTLLSTIYFSLVLPHPQHEGEAH